MKQGECEMFVMHSARAGCDELPSPSGASGQTLGPKDRIVVQFRNHYRREWAFVAHCSVCRIGHDCT